MKTQKQLQTLQLTHTDAHTLIAAQLAALFADMPTGYRCGPEVVSDVVVKASVDGGSIEATTRELATVPSGACVRDYLNEQLAVEQLSQWEAHLNEQLRQHLPRRVRRRAQALAADFHDEPFYGKTPLLQLYACRGAAKSGTTWFYRIATVYVLHHQVPYTLALTFVLPEDSPASVLRRLLAQVAALDIAVAGLYLDKGFCGQAVIEYLQTQTLPAIIACPLRGKTGGTRALCVGRRSYTTQYTFNAGTAEAYEATVVVVRTYALRHGQRRAVWLLYVTLHLADVLPATIQARYRARFGIEGSYRSFRETHASTTARNPALRFFLMGVTFLILNLWVALRWRFCQRPRRGGRQVAQTEYSLTRHRTFLRRAIEDRYGLVLTLTAWVPPLDV